VGNFYPETAKPSDFLREYTRRLTTVEGNTTFYAVPAQKTLEGWIEGMPTTFRFCPKVPKAISHEGKLADNVERAQAFVELMRQLGSRLGPMFLQLPPRYSPRLLGDLQAFLAQWPRDVRLAVEVRHLDWFDEPHNEALNQLLTEHNMARVTIDTRPIRDLSGEDILAGSVYQSLLEARERKPDVPVVPKRTSDFIFIRYIGHPDIELNKPYLKEWGDYLIPQLQGSADVYMFCHSPNNFAAPYLCRTIYAQMEKEVDIPPLPWNELADEDYEQGQLL
jgi:uncharacterized protein YecE (DUF72 family)